MLLHADGQYAPELLPQIVEPLDRGEADAVFGSRMMVPRQALRGGMPLYKYVGNKILSTFENRVVGTDLTEWHSGYRAYSVEALRVIPFEDNSDDYDFDTGIILQLFEAGRQMSIDPADADEWRILAPLQRAQMKAAEGMTLASFAAGDGRIAEAAPP